MNRNGRNFNAEYSNIPGRTSDNRRADIGRGYARASANQRSDQRIQYRSAGQAVNQQRPRVNNMINASEHGAYRNTNSQRTNPSSRVDRIQPMNRGVNYQPGVRNRQNIMAKAPYQKVHVKGRKRKKNSFWRDFFLGMGIGFAIFGTAAIFVVRAITDLFLI